MNEKIIKYAKQKMETEGRVDVRDVAMNIGIPPVSFVCRRVGELLEQRLGYTRVDQFEYRGSPMMTRGEPIDFSFSWNSLASTSTEQEKPKKKAAPKPKPEKPKISLDSV